jgi:uncharacterized membrane protein
VELVFESIINVGKSTTFVWIMVELILLSTINSGKSTTFVWMIVELVLLSTINYGSNDKSLMFKFSKSVKVYYVVVFIYYKYLNVNGSDYTPFNNLFEFEFEFEFEF